MTSEKPLFVRVAEALGWTDCFENGFGWFGRPAEIDPALYPNDEPQFVYLVPRFDIRWSDAGPLIERFRIELWRKDIETPSEFYKASASIIGGPCGDGDTALLAICDLILALSEAGKL